MAAKKNYQIISINPPPRMPMNINREFELTIKPSGSIQSIRSQRPAFAKVRGYSIISTGSSQMVVKVRIHGMNAGVLNVPFDITFSDGEVQFVIRVV